MYFGLYRQRYLAIGKKNMKDTITHFFVTAVIFLVLLILTIKVEARREVKSSHFSIKRDTLSQHVPTNKRVIPWGR